MHWKEKLYTVSATVFACASLFTWYALIDSRVESKPLAWGLLISSIAGGGLALGHLLGGGLRNASRGLPSGEVPDSIGSDPSLDQIEANEERLADLEARLEFAERLLVEGRGGAPRSQGSANRHFGSGSRPTLRTPTQRTPQP